MENKKKEALLVDFGQHYKQMRHAAYAWRHYNLHVMCGRTALDKLQLVNDHEMVLIEDERHELRFWLGAFLHMVRNRFKYNRLIVLTAPEYSDGATGILVRFLWLCVSIIYTNCIYLYVKNGSAYGESLQLRLTLKFARKVFFESKLQKNSFEEHVLKDNKRFAVSYVYYSDIPGNERQCTANAGLPDIRTGKNILVGLIGAFDTSRRNYEPLIAAYENNLLVGLNFLQIGRFVENSETRCRMLPFTSFLKDEFSVEELDELLESCDVLLSMNTESLGYQSHKGTAAFGEAASVRKPLVVPEFMRVHGEYSDFCFYYDDAQSLVRAIHESVDHVEPETFKRFRSSLIKEIERV